MEGVQRTDDSILIENSDRDLRAVLVELGLPAATEMSSNDDVAAHLDRLRAQLAALRDHPEGIRDIGASTVIGTIHFPLRPTIYFAFLATVKAMGAVLALTTNPIAGGITTAIVVLDMAEKAQQLISLLDEGEIRAIEALGAAVSAKPSGSTTAGMASLAEINTLLSSRGQAIPGLAATLQFMTEDKRGVRRFTIGGEPYYQVIT